MMRYICVHGHFYQPPRENPSLEAIEVQDSAYPYHDWNERVCAECYAPNAASRILDDQQRILTLVNNYAQISFNFGPTLLSWVETKAPEVYAAIQEGDKLSAQKYDGHGSAIAQAYNHLIMPLANRRDKDSQVKWGIADFERRFKRKPEGMWLPETAVDLETLEVLAENGILFTILAPRQAKRVRRKGSRSWKDVSGERIDPSRAYMVRLPSRKTISVFFYDGPVSQAVAFEGILNNGQAFAERLLTAFSDTRTWPQLAHIATDGESYGHHHHYGEMALSSALHHIESNKLAELTNYGRFLEQFPPDHFVEIIPNTSWSCVHGVERWRSNCGCNSGAHGEWNQEWRAPLRVALDWLRDKLSVFYEDKSAPLLKRPWAARDAYIRVILDRSDESLAAFFAEHATHPLDSAEQVQALKLLEMQRHALLMYTSCGWFFDELSGIETVQVIHYAGRAVQLAEQSGAEPIEAEFLDRLAAAKSNLPEHGDGRQIYEKFVRSARIDMERVAAHFAISSLFEAYEAKTNIYCYRVEREDYHVEAEGKLRLATGRARFDSTITRESATFSFAALNLGHTIMAGVRNPDPERDDGLRAKLVQAFSVADAAELIRIFDEEFGKHTFSLRSLFRDEQRKISNIILNDSVESAAAAYRAVYENQAPLIRFLSSLSIPVPPALKSAASFALNSQLRMAIERPDTDAESIRGYLREAANSNVDLDTATLEFVMRKRLEQEARQFASDPAKIENVQKLNRVIDIAKALPFPVILWEVQNISYAPLRTLWEQRRNESNGNGTQRQYLDELNALGEKLRIQVGA
jgi:alpha-amylase/alpha-mannosidase (GH57 family)